MTYKKLPVTKNLFLVPKAKYLEIGEVVTSKKKEKTELLNSLTITIDTVAYDADGRAVGNMGAIVSLANWKFNQAVSTGLTNEEAYQAIYIDTTINWKGADNSINNKTIEGICLALEASMNAMAPVLGV